MASESQADMISTGASATHASTAHANTGDVADEATIRRATALVIVIMCLTTVSEASYGAANGGFGEAALVLALVVLPLLYVVPATRPLWLRHRYLLLGVQGALTYLPFAWYGASWAPSGWLAGLVLLTVSSPTSWFVAAILAALEAAVWSGTVVHLTNQPTTVAAVWAMIAFVFDALILFGLARLTDLIKAVHAARDELAEAAVTAERVRAADDMRAAIGDRLAAAASRSAAALRAVGGMPTVAREHIAAAAVTAREALGEVRDVAARYRDVPWPETASAEPGELPAPRLAQVVLVALLGGLAFLYSFLVADNDYGVPGGYSDPVVAWTIADAAVLVILQLRHSWPCRSTFLSSTGLGTGRPRGWPATLLLQAAATYALVPTTGFHPIAMSGFLAGSALLLIPGAPGRAAYAAVIASLPVVYAVKPPTPVPQVLPLTTEQVIASLPVVHAVKLPPPVPPVLPLTTEQMLGGLLYVTVESAMLGLLVFGLSRLAQLAVQLEELRKQLAREAVAGERLRLARDTHDLLGLGLAAIAMKADLIGKLIGRDCARAGEEIADLARICATARADLRLVVGEARELPFDAELATARDVLASAGIDVRAHIGADPAPEAAAVLVPVVREAVTNILKHSSASYCVLELTADADLLRLLISNDGSNEADSAPLAAAGPAGSGLRNLAARLEAAGGHLAARREVGTFSLAVELPLPASRAAPVPLLVVPHPPRGLPT